MRRDVHVPNESDGFVFTSASLRGRGLSPGATAWTAAATGGDLLALEVESEDAANIRIVVGGTLEPAEQNEWVGRTRGRLRIPDGRLALCSGTAYVDTADAWADDTARVVEIPSGEYDVTVYCYASAPNGRACLDEAGDEAMGTWFRRTHPGREMPAWLHNLCIHDPELDPGHQKSWKRAKVKRGGAVVDFLLHLEVPVKGFETTPLTGDGFMRATDCRRPDPFPLGIAAVGLEGRDEDGEDETSEPAPPPVARPAGRAATTRRSHVVISGGPVPVPIAKITRLARLAWLCHPYTQPVIQMTFAGKVPPLEEVEAATFETSGRDLHVTFDDTGQPAGAAAAMTAFARQLAPVAEGAHLELSTARRSPAGSPLGLHSYSGPVRGGVWEVTEAFPEVDAARLTEALSLCEAIENGRRLTARDAVEAEQLEAHVRGRIADLFGSNALQRTDAELALKRRDPVLFEHVVARVFWHRYADAWPLQDGDREG